MHPRANFASKNKSLFCDQILARLWPYFCGRALSALNEVPLCTPVIIAISSVIPKKPLKLLTRKSPSSPSATHNCPLSPDQQTKHFRLPRLIRREWRRLLLSSDRRTNLAQKVFPCSFLLWQSRHSTLIFKPV